MSNYKSKDFAEMIGVSVKTLQLKIDRDLNASYNLVNATKYKLA